MHAVLFLEEERLLIVDLCDWLKNRKGTTIWEEVVDWLYQHHNLIPDHIKKESRMIFMDLPEAPDHDMSYLIQGLAEDELTELDLIERLENHTTETIESVGKDDLQKAIAGGKLLRSVLTFLVRQNFSPIGCLILAHQDNEG